MDSPTFCPASDSSLLATFGDQISDTTSAKVVQLFHALSAYNPPWLENLHPAYTTLLIDFNPRLTTYHKVLAEVQRLTLTPAISEIAKTVELEVHYDGVDIEEIARIHSLTVEHLIQLHSMPIYRVAFLGFAPGFAYLTGLPPALATPRRAVPRLQVPAGSVAIGGGQTGVYPADLPGGWNLIGRILRRTPLPPDWVAPGDHVRFLPV